MKKYERLIDETKNIVQEYSDMKLTIRQVYYRLVSKQIIKNNRSQYVYFDQILTEYRKNNIEFSKYFEDKGRSVNDTTYELYPIYKFSRAINYRLNYIKKGYPRLEYNRYLLQDEIPIILLEKDALSTIFERAISGYPNYLISCHGFNSFTQMYELMNKLKAERKERKFYVYIFTDFDDSGLLIQNNFLNQMRKYLKIKFENVQRIALNKEQIEKYDIPQNPVKKTTHSKYNLPYFVELDALEPHILTDLAKKCVKKHFNKDLYKSISKALDRRNNRLKNKYFKELKKIDLSKI